MPLVAEVAYNATNTADAVTKIKDRMVDMGWTLHDDQFSASDYYVMKTTGEDADELPFYVQILHGVSTDRVVFRAHAWWNNTTHEGNCRFSTLDSEYDLVSDDNSDFYLWIYGNLNIVSIISKVGINYDASLFGKVTPFWDVKGTLQSNVATGSDVVLTLASGEADNFVAGKTYQIVGANGEGRQPVVVNSISGNTVTVSSLSYDFNADSRIGQTPYPWLATTLRGNNSVYWLRQVGTGIGSESVDNFIDYTLLFINYIEPDERANQAYVLFPITCYESESVNSSYFGYIDDLYLRSSGPSTYEDTMSIQEQDDGTATSASTTTLTDTTKSWSTDTYAGKAIIITAGIGAGQIRKIISNTPDTITTPVWLITPDSTSQYVICNEAWRYFYFASTTYSAAFKEVG